MHPKYIHFQHDLSALFYKLITMNLIGSVIQLLQKGFSARQISREIHLSRNTVKFYLDRFNASGFSIEQLQKMDNSDLSIIVENPRKLPPPPNETDPLNNEIKEQLFL